MPDDHWNSSNLTQIWFHLIRTVLRKIYWMNVELNDVRPYMFELTNATITGLTQMLIPQDPTNDKHTELKQSVLDIINFSCSSLMPSREAFTATFLQSQNNFQTRIPFLARGFSPVSLSSIKVNG